MTKLAPLLAMLGVLLAPAAPAIAAGLAQAGFEALARGEATAALAAADAAESAGENRNEVLFLRGQAWFALGNYERAVAAYRAILAAEPGAVRVRLELARTYFVLEKDQQAAFHFRFALSAKHLPPAVAANIKRYLDAIRARRRWRLDLSFALAPDTNVNAATKDSVVDILGLPFRLDDDARQTSGVGLVYGAYGEYRAPLVTNASLVGTAFVNRRDYSGNRFDDSQVVVTLGPGFRFGGQDLGVSALSGRRWFGGREYSYDLGVELRGQSSLSRRLAHDSRLRLVHRRYDDAKASNGPQLSVQSTWNYALTPTSFVRAVGFVARDQASAPFAASSGIFAALGYYRELPHGLSAYVEPGVGWRGFDGDDPLFEAPRNDRSWQLRLTTLYRGLDLFGFTPSMNAFYERRSSSLGAFSYDRWRLELGFVAAF